MDNFFNAKKILFFGLIILFATTAPLSFGQKRKSKKNWLSPDKSFALTIPIKLKNTDLYGGADKNSPEYTSIKTYEGSISDHYFLVLVLDYGKDIKNKEIKEKFGGLEFVIGGDDDHKFEEKYLKIDNLNAKEITYLNQNKKGLMIDTGKQIIVLGLIVGKRENLNSVVAKEFLSSFRLLQS